MKKSFLSAALAFALCFSLTISAEAVAQTSTVFGGASQSESFLPPGTTATYSNGIIVDYHSDYGEDVTVTKECARAYWASNGVGIGATVHREETATCPIDKLEETINLEQVENYDGEVFDGLSLSILRLPNGDSWDIVYKLKQNKKYPDHSSLYFKIINSADRIYELGGTDRVSIPPTDMGVDIFNSDYVDFSCFVDISDTYGISTLTFMSSRDGGTANYDAIKEFVGFDFSTNKKLIGDLTIQMHDCIDLEKGAWYENAIIYCSSAGYVTGYGNGKFGPNDSITFAQLATILSKCSASEEYEYYIYNVDHWAKDAMGFAVRNNIFMPSDVLTNGKPDVSKWDRPMTREQAVYSIVQYIKFVDLDMPNNAANIPDIDSVDAQYREGVKLAYQYGITSGVDAKGTFNPKSPVTRAEICQMIYNNRL